MKKIILSLILALAVIFSCISPAFAAESGAWILNENAMSITHNGETYLPVDVAGYYFLVADSNRITLEYKDETTKFNYNGSYIYTHESTDYKIIETFIVGESYYLFVAEDYIDEFNKILNGENVDFYTIENLFGVQMSMWKSEYQDCTREIYTTSISDYVFYDLYATGSDYSFSCVVGAVVKNIYTGTLGIIKYSDYDSSYFFADGSFNQNTKNSVTIYAIDDEDLQDRISEFLVQTPDDELDWIVGEDPTHTSKVVSAIIFFGIIPLAIVAFCVIMLIKAKKKMYRTPLIVLLSSTVLLILSAIILYF